MIEEESNFMNLNEIYEYAMQENGHDPLVSINLTLEKYHSRVEKVSKKKEISEQGLKEVEEQINKEVFRELSQNYSKDYYFSIFTHTLLPSADDLFVLKKQFTAYLAVNNFLSYILCLPHQDLSSIKISKRTAKFYYQNNKLTFQEGILTNLEAVPFRLTKNFQVN